MIQKNLFRFAILTAATIIVLIAPARAEDRVLHDDWYALYMMGNKLGWNHEIAVEKAVDGRKVVETSVRMEIKIARMGQSIEIVQAFEIVEDAEGRLIYFRSYQKQSAMESEVRGTVEEGKIRITRTLGGKSQPSYEVPLDPEALPPAALACFMKAKGLKPGMAYEVKSFLTESPETAPKMSMKIAGNEDVDLLGTKRTLVRIDSTIALKGQKISTKTWVDEEWTQWRISVSGLGAMDLYRVPREVAVLEGEVREIFMQMLIPPDRKIEGARELRDLKLRLELAGGEAFDNFPPGGGQEILRQGAGFLELRIRSTEPATALTRPLPAAGMEVFLANTPYLQKDDPIVREIAEKAAGAETDAWVTAKALEKWVFDNIKKKNMGVAFATAAEVAKNLEGDCSEHGVLLAALCRAASIPSRVVGGLVYAEELKVPGAEERGAFGFHMWTEVWIGEWIALDATLGLGFADATHVALARSAMESESSQFDLLPIGKYIGKLSIKVLE